MRKLAKAGCLGWSIFSPKSASFVLLNRENMNSDVEERVINHEVNSLA